MEQLELLKPGKLIVATEGDMPPYSMMDEKGGLDGLEIRVVGEIARRLGLEYTPVLLSWEEILRGLETNDFDISSACMDITEPRKNLFDFCDSWMQSGVQKFIRKEDAFTPDDQIFSGGCGVLVNTTWVELAEKNNLPNLKIYKRNKDLVEGLLKKEVRIIVTDLLAATYLIEKEEISLRPHGDPLALFHKGWAVPKGKPNLRKAVNATLKGMIRDKTFEKMASAPLSYRFYFGGL